MPKGKTRFNYTFYCPRCGFAAISDDIEVIKEAKREHRTMVPVKTETGVIVRYSHCGLQRVRRGAFKDALARPNLRPLLEKDNAR